MPKRTDETNGAYIVSWDFSEEPGVLLVGRKVEGRIDIINAFKGKEAHDIYETLSHVEEEII